MTKSDDVVGFIITRHVTSPATNEYWQLAVQHLRRLYPEQPIVIIDDNSDPAFLSQETITPIENLTIITAPPPHHGRGELLPYLYLARYRWFPKAVILHDSTFLQKYVPFDQLTVPVLPLWHYPYDLDHPSNVVRLTQALTNHERILRKVEPKLRSTSMTMLKPQAQPQQKFALCFGGQAFITLPFLDHLHAKYTLTNLQAVVKRRPDRCALERVLGAIFYEEYPALARYRSLYGHIFQQYHAFHYTYEDYQQDETAARQAIPCIKLWTGR